VLYILREAHHVRTVQQANPNAWLVVPETWMEVVALCSDLQRGAIASHSIRAVVLDSVDDLQELYKAELLAARRRCSPGIQDWGEIISNTMSLFRSFRDLPTHVVYVAKAKEVAEEVEGDTERSRRVVRPLLIGQASHTQLMGMVHCAGYFFPLTDDDGDVQYVSLWQPASDRFLVKPAGRLPRMMPQDIEEVFRLALLPAGSAPATPVPAAEPAHVPAEPTPEASTQASAATATTARNGNKGTTPGAAAVLGTLTRLMESGQCPSKSAASAFLLMATDHTWQEIQALPAEAAAALAVRLEQAVVAHATARASEA